MASEKVLHLTADNFAAEALQSDKPVLVDFWAAWCGPCRMLGPVIDELADDYDGRVKVCKCNIDEQESLAVQYRVQTIPTVLLFVNGQAVEKTVGAVPKDQLEDLIDKHLA